jgi:MFS family permease
MAASIVSGAGRAPAAKAALRFVLLVGVVSIFADMTYEGSRSITGPYLAVLGATGTIVGFVGGLGELLGYGLRIVSGRLSDRTGQYWPITFLGYIVQMASVPLLAIAGRWEIAALLIVAERIGKAVRNPPRDVMLSHAGSQIGQGWAFGVHEALDQFGALVGPLIAAGVLYGHGQYQQAFALLLIPAALTLTFLVVTRLQYPKPSDLQAEVQDIQARGLPPVYWIYVAGAGLVASGFADFTLMAYHFQKTGAVPAQWIPLFYSVAMAVSGAGSLLFGRLFDRVGIGVLIPLTAVSALFAPLAFLGSTLLALAGTALWGLGMGVHESIIAAAVAHMVPVNRRGSAYGIFTTAYGVLWFVGSAAMGALYDISLPALIIFSMLAEFAAVPCFAAVARRMR